MDLHDYAEKNRLSARSIMDFTNLVNPLGPSTKAKNALRKHISGLFMPPDKQARYLARFISKRERVGLESILFGQGAKGLIDAVFATIRPARVLVPGPVPESYRETAERRDVAVVEAPPIKGSPFMMDAESIYSQLGEVNAVLVPHPHPMTGVVLPEEVLSRLVAEADRLGTALIIDESLRDFTDIASPLSAVIESKQCIIVRSFSTYYGLAGLPIGYGLGPVEFVEKIGRNMVPGAVNSLGIEAALASLRDKMYGARTAQFIAQEKEFFRKSIATLEGISFYDTPCPFFLIAMGEGRERFRGLCERYRILIDDYFEIMSVHYLRVPVKQHKWNARLLKTLKNALGASRP